MAPEAHTGTSTLELDRRALDVLFLCSRTRFADAQETSLRRLESNDVDWQRVIELAAIHGTRALVYRTLTQLRPGVVPAPLLESLRDEVLSMTGHSLFLTGELVDVMGRFERHRIQAMPYKGPVLAASAYGGVGLREFHDLDIVVRKRDVESAATMLLAAGYTEVDTSKDGDAYSRVLVRDASIIDLHWAFAGIRFFFRVNPAQLWERRTHVELSGARISSLSPEDTLLLLCMHGAKHCWSRLGWICDIAELLGSTTIDWDALGARAKRYGAERMLYLGLFLACDFLGAILPRDVYARASQPSVIALANMVRSWMVQGESGAAKPIERETFYITMRERFIDRVRHFVGGMLRFALPNAQDQLALPMPRPLRFLHCLIRPARLLSAYGNPAMVLKRLTGRP